MTQNREQRYKIILPFIIVVSGFIIAIVNFFLSKDDLERGENCWFFWFTCFVGFSLELLGLFCLYMIRIDKIKTF